MGWYVIFNSTQRRTQVRGIITPYAPVKESTLMYVAAAMTAFLLVLWVTVPSQLMPSPGETWNAFYRLLETRGLIHELGVSLKLILQATVIASVLAMLLSYSQVVAVMRPIVAFFENWRFFSSIGLTFVAMILIHNAHWIKVSVIVCFMLPYILSSLASSIRAIEEDQFNHARTMKLKHWGTTWEVIIRGRIDQVIESVRQNFPISWGLIPVVESLVRTEGGIGLLLVEEGKYLRFDGLLALIIVIFVVGKLQDLALRWARQAICPYVSIGTGALK
jgi:NitT/TauT family transport system permease protein